MMQQSGQNTTKPTARRRWRGAGAAMVLGSAVLAPIGLGTFSPADAAAANNNLIITPGTGLTLSGPTTFLTPAAGCPAPANSAVPTISGTGVTGTNPDGSTNIIGALAVETPGVAITLTTQGLTWDAIAADKSIPRPLNGTFTIKVICLEDGEPTGVFYDRDITFTKTGGEAAGSPGAYAVVGADPATPTPGAATPTPTPGAATPTPTPGAGTPTPAPSATATPAPTATPSATTTPTPSTTPAASTTPTPSVSPAAVSPTPAPGAQLPNTGATSRPLLFLASILLLGGAAIIVATSPDDTSKRT